MQKVAQHSLHCINFVESEPQLMSLHFFVLRLLTTPDVAEAASAFEPPAKSLAEPGRVAGAVLGLFAVAELDEESSAVAFSAEEELPAGRSPGVPPDAPVAP